MDSDNTTTSIATSDDPTTSYGKTYYGRSFSFKDGVFKILNEDNELMPVTATVELDVKKD